jgi:peptidoglycan/LPS O-acetylase OafA/YrhL
MSERISDAYSEGREKPISPAHVASQNRGLHHIAPLDGIRGIAALLVMGFHFVGHHNEPKLVRMIAIFGQTGVDLFFVLSGFLITRILLLSRESPHYFRSFYARRALRIFPLYYGFTVLFFFVFPIFAHTQVPSFFKQIYTWFYLQNVANTFPNLVSAGPAYYWSLAVEEHFYLIWPLAVFLLSRHQFKYFIIGTLLVPIIVRFLFLRHGIEVFYFTLTRMDSIAFGALLAYLVTSDKWTDRHARFFGPLALLLIPGLLPPFAVLSASHTVQIVKLSLIPCFYFAALGFFISDATGQRLSSAFSAWPLRRTGRISYGLYVFHPTCFEYVQKAFKANFLADFCCSFGATFLVAYLSFRFFESPISQLKRRFHYEISPG